ncbi:MAG: hypothetical protein NC181_00390 [Clostridium sp.]|nr:hypothetical protein [Clostridium sp.]MCM1443877.1 hypothetical protein [Candidatus Amulumruptor caecigallinarius]
MKKLLGIFISAITIFTLTGCGEKGETVTCTQKEDGTSETYTVTFENDKITKAVIESKQTDLSGDELEMAYQMVKFSKSLLSGKEGIKVTTSKGNDSVSAKMEIDYTKLSDDMKSSLEIDANSSKKEFIDSMTEEGYTCK